MATYSDWQQRQLDIAFSEQMDRRPLPVCFCKVCGREGHILCGSAPLPVKENAP